MMTPWLTVLHHPARPDYLRRTLGELDHAGAGALAAVGELYRLIAVDGDTYAVNAPPGWDVFSVGDGRSGIRRAMLATMHAAAAAGAGHLLFFEDDVSACRNAVIALHTIPVPPSCGFLTACNYRGPTLVERRRLPRMAIVAADGELTGGEFWGNQALKLPAKALSHLAGQTIAEDDKPHNGDVWLGQHLASRTAPWPHFGILSPSIFQHTGARSLAHAEKTFASQRRQAHDFDPDFDALAISNIYAAAGARMFE